jgi:prepilin-type processing-associated H-X9-DG protein
MATSRSFRGGFHTGQLVIVVASAALVTGLLVTAVQKSRTFAQYLRCQSNLMHLGLALQSYHAANGCFPPGIVCGTHVAAAHPPPIGEYPGWLPPCTGALSFLLPHLGREDLFRQIPPEFLTTECTAMPWAYSTPPFDTENRNNTGLPAWAMPRCETLECPAATADSISGTRFCVVDAYVSTSWTKGPQWDGKSTYLFTPGGTGDTAPWCDWVPPTTTGFPGPDVADLATTNYAANGGALGQCNPRETLRSFLARDNATFSSPDQGVPTYTNVANIPALPLVSYVGPFGVNTRTRLADIADGTSYTLAFGETLGGVAFPDGPTEFRIARAAGVAFPALGAIQLRPVLGTYSSNHQGVANFLWCDGSVRPIRKFSILAYDNLPAAWYVFQAAAGMRDGLAIDPGLKVD